MNSINLDSFNVKAEVKKSSVETNMNLKMLQHQTLGAKYKLLDWITIHLPKNVKTFLDGFGRSQSMIFGMKMKYCL